MPLSLNPLGYNKWNYNPQIQKYWLLCLPMFLPYPSSISSYNFELLCSISSTWRYPFSISCIACLVVGNSPSFCLSWYILSSSSFLKDNFVRYIILGWHFFLSIHWICYPLTSSLYSSYTKYTVLLLRIPCVWWVTFLLLLSRFSLFFGVQQFDYNILVWVSEFILCEVHWHSWIYRFISLMKFGKFLAIISSYVLSSLFFLSSSGTHMMCMLFCLMVFHRSFRFGSFLFILLSFLSSDSIISIVLSSSSLILFSACSNLLLSPSSEFFIAVIVLLYSRISVWFIFVTSVPL